MITGILVSQPPSENLYPCELVGFGGVVCGRCGGHFQQLLRDLKVGDKCNTCGAQVVEIRGNAVGSYLP